MQRTVERAEALRADYASGRDPRAFLRLEALARPLRALPLRSELGLRAELALEPVTTTLGDEQTNLERLSIVGAEGSLEQRLAAWCAAGRIRLRRGDFEALTREWFALEGELAKGNDVDTQIMARVIGAHALAWTQRVDLGSALLVDAKAMAVDEDRPFAEHLCQAQLAHVALHAEDRRAALDLSDDAVRRAKALGLPRLFALTHWSRGWAQARFGELDEAAFSLELAARVQGLLGESAPAAALWARLVELHGWRADEPAVARAGRHALAQASRAPHSRAAIEVHVAFARRYRARGDESSAEMHLGALVELASRSSDTQAEAALESIEESTGPFARELARPRTTIVVNLEGTRLTTPSGKVIDLRRRRAVRRILAALAAQLVRDPGETIAADTLLHVGWPDPGTRSTPPSLADLHSAIWTLRKLGLGAALETTGSGYRLSPAQVVVEPR